MLDIKYRFTYGQSDLSEVIRKYQNIMARIVAEDKTKMGAEFKNRKCKMVPTNVILNQLFSVTKMRVD